MVSAGPWSHLIDAFAMEEAVEEDSIWYYSTVKNLDNAVKIYQLNCQSHQVIAIPTSKTISIPEKPQGLSVGKYHGLVWTENGHLYTWGCKNLALGLA